jgi:deazaflavin-dependent oxidoreductase (nitroreductase family)
MPPRRPSPVLRRLLRAPAALYRARCGWLLGHRFLLLIHRGRRSGRRHRTVLEIIAYRADGPECVVMSGFGPDAQWLRNIAADPAPEIVVGTTRFTAAWRRLDTPEAVAALAGYEHRHRLLAPLVRRVLSRLLGWRYDGSDAARRRAVAALPLVAFRPRGAALTSGSPSRAADARTTAGTRSA